jgi:hypothetical protein
MEENLEMIVGHIIVWVMQVKQRNFYQKLFIFLFYLACNEPKSPRDSVQRNKYMFCRNKIVSLF